MLEIGLEKEILERFGNRLKEAFNEMPLKEIYLESLKLFYRLFFILLREKPGLDSSEILRYPGRIYETILDYRPRLSVNGDYYLEYGSMKRRRAGSYYTPDYIIRY